MEDEWVNRINKLILEENPQFINRKDKCLPKYLMKYRSVSEQAIDSLKNDTVWFDKPSRYNDPYDCSIKMTSEFVSNYINQKINKLESKMGKLNRESKIMLYNFQLSGLIDRLNEYIQNSCLISCFSTQIDSMLMWSHSVK